MIYRLKDRYLLRGWEKLPFAIVDKRSGQASFTRAKVMQALTLCDGEVDTALPFFGKDVRDIISQLERDGVVEACDSPRPLSPEQAYRSYPARYISTAHWSVTGRCNMRCKHCYMSAPDAKFGELSHEEALGIARQIIDCGIMNVSLTGGEPLVRADFLDIVDTLLEGGVNITTIYSNGLLVTDELLEALETRGIRPEFNMSYDGVGCHDWLRGINGAQDAVEAAFRRCRDHGFPTGAEMCIHQNNRETLRDTVNRLAELGCRSLKTNPVSNVGAWKEGGYGEAIPLDDLFQIYLDYIPRYYEDGMPLAIQLGGFFFASPKHPERFNVPSVKNCADPVATCVCEHARKVMYISAEGRALPCMSLSGQDIQANYPLITELSLAQCITDSTYMDLIDTRVSTVLDHNPECRECEFALQCIGGCRAAALDTSPDDILAPDRATCEVFKGAWIPRIVQAATEAIPDAESPNLEQAGYFWRKAGEAPENQ